MPNRRDETVSLPRDRLYEARLFGIILQDLPDLANRSVYAVVGVEEDILAPDPLDDVLPADDLSVTLNQDRQNLGRNAFEFDHATVATQGMGGEIQLENLAKFNEARNSYRL